MNTATQCVDTVLAEAAPALADLLIASDAAEENSYRVEEVLRRVICADKDNDAPRLRLADWWTVQGLENQAEFVRVQCALWEECAGAAQGAFATARELDLRERERVLLAEKNARRFPKHADAIQWRRGFMHTITLAAHAWIQYVDAFLGHEPLEVVKLTTVPEIEWLDENCAPVYGAGTTERVRLVGMKQHIQSYSFIESGYGLPRLILEMCYPGIEFEVPHGMLMGKPVYLMNAISPGSNSDITLGDWRDFQNSLNRLHRGPRDAHAP